MEQKQECPVCEEEIVSDATVSEYCALCGMIIRDAPVEVIKNERGSKYFCSDGCYNKYLQFHREMCS